MSLPATMQWELLPPLNTRTPQVVIAGLLEPAYDIAGDAFDYAVGDSDLQFAIIDGMGHGIASTLLTGLAVGAYRHARRNGAPIPEIHKAIDQALTDYYGDDSFATGIVGKLTTATGRLEWSCAGHPPPLLLQGGEVHELAPTGTVMGRLSRAGYAEQAREIAPGDRVVIFSDGITEAASPAGEPFGDARLRAFLIDHATLPVEAFAAALLDALAAWSGHAGRRSAFVTPVRRAASRHESFDGRFADDLTLVVLQITANKSDARRAGEGITPATPVERKEKRHATVRRRSGRRHAGIEGVQTSGWVLPSRGRLPSTHGHPAPWLARH